MTKKRLRPTPRVHLQIGPREVACQQGEHAAKGRGWTCSTDVADVTCLACRGNPRFRFAITRPLEHLRLAGVSRPRPTPPPEEMYTAGRTTTHRNLRFPPSLWSMLSLRAKREGTSTTALVLRACRRLLATPEATPG